MFKPCLALLISLAIVHALTPHQVHLVYDPQYVVAIRVLQCICCSDWTAIRFLMNNFTLKCHSSLLHQTPDIIYVRY